MGNTDTKIGWPVVDMTGKTIIVTGANSGIGYETAKHLAFLGGRVILACRSEIRAEAAKLRMKADFMEWKEANPDFQRHISTRRSSVKNDDDISTRRSLVKNDDDTASNSDEGSSSPTVEVPSNSKTRRASSDSSDTLDELRLEYMHLDLASLQSVVDFAEEFKSKDYSLDRLICNAGIAGVPHGITMDGFENHFQINYLAHFLLILRLFPLMRSSEEECRIIHLSSQHHESGVFELSKLKNQTKGTYGPLEMYSNSKLFQTMMMHCLEKRLQESNITNFCVAPGSTDTRLNRRLQNETKRAAKNILNYKGNVNRDLTKAAASSIYMAVHPNTKDLRGYYFHKGNPITTSWKSRSDKHQQVLWNFSLESLQKYTTPELLEGLTLSA